VSEADTHKMKTKPTAAVVFAPCRKRVWNAAAQALIAGSVLFAGNAIPAQQDVAHATSDLDQPAAIRVKSAQPAASQQSGPAAATLPPEGTLDLVVGIHQPFQIDRTLTRVAVADPAVADVMVTRGTRGSNLLLIARAPGTTSLLVWTREQAAPQRYVVRVSGAATRALLGDAGPSVSVVGGTTIIKGSAPTVEAHQQAVAAAYAAGGAGRESGAGAGKDAGREGAASQGTIVDQSTVAISPVVQVDVKVVEFSRTVLKEFGINLQKIGSGFLTGLANPGTSVNLTGNLIANPPLANAFSVVAAGTSSGLSAGLSILQSDGLARVLAEPTLVALSGQSASFLAGGEIPVPVPQGLGSTAIEYKSYGIGLTLTPTVLAPNRIALKVAPEASALDFAHAVTISGVSVPALTTRRADTTVELGDGESFVIGGLIDRETITNIDKVPFLGDLPIIGAFFKSFNYQQSDKELVIVVTPHLVSPLARGTVVPLPGETSEQREGPVWRSFVGGMAARDALPGFSK
jgi:pilus assembly protein CpaC